MLDTTSRTWALAILFIAMMAIGYSFSFIEAASGGPLLDSLLSGAEAKARLMEMTAEQKTAHFWGTVLNDTLYPFAYGGLFAGLVWRFAGTFRKWMVMPALAAGLVDLAENTTQALALAGNDAFIGLKDILTPPKFGLVLLAIVLVLVSVVIALVRRVRS